MKRIMILLLECIFVLGLFSCNVSIEDDDSPDEENVQIILNNSENASFAAVEVGQKNSLRLSNNASAVWTVSGTASATLSASSGTLVYLTARTAGSVTVTAATENGRKYTRELRITAKDTAPNEDNEPNVSFSNRSAYRVSVCRDGLTNEIAVVGAYGTESVYVSPGRGEITFHFRYSYCVIDDADSGTVWMAAADSSVYTYAVDSVDVASGVVPIQIPAPKNPTFRDSYLVVENISEQPVSLYNKNTQHKLYNQEKYYIQPQHSGVYSIQPDAPFEGFSLKSSSAETAVSPFHAESGVVYKCEFDGSGADIGITAYAPWRRTVGYTVKHYQQGDDLETYTLIKTEFLTGIADKITAATALPYKGFTARPFKQKYISEYGTTVVEIYYDRNEYTVTFDSNNGTGDTATQIFYYGVPQKLNENVFSYPGYTFTGWGLSKIGDVVYANQAKFCGEYTAGITLYAKWGSGITVTGDTVGDIDLSDITDEYTIKVAGSISQSTLQTLADKMKNSSVSINLDLSEAVLTAIASTSDNKSIFADCPLNLIVLPETLETIGSYAFFNCSIKSLIIPANVQTIGSDAFYYCQNLESVEIDGTETVGDYAFCYCKNLKTVVLKNIRTIGRYAFCECTSLSSVTMDSVGSIGEYTFGWCTSVSSIAIDAETIGSCAFRSCISLTSAIIGNNVKSIGSYSFNDCFALTSVQFEDTDNWYYKPSSYEYKYDFTNAAENASRLEYSNYTYYKK